MAPSVLTQPPTSKLQSINIRSMIPELSRVSNQGLVSGLGVRVRVRVRVRVKVGVRVKG